MMFRVSLLFIFFCLLGAVFFSAPALAANVQLSGKIVDSSGNPIMNTKVIVSNAQTKKAVGTFMADPFGNYRLPVAQGVYTITVIPPANSGLQEYTQTNVQVTGDTTHTIQLPATSKFPLSNKNNPGSLGIVQEVIVSEIAVVIIVLFGYIGWKQKLFKPKRSRK